MTNTSSNEMITLVEQNNKICGEGKDFILYEFKCIKYTDNDDLSYSIEMDISNEHTGDSHKIITSHRALTDTVASAITIINGLDEIFNFNNYLKQLLNRHILSLLLKYLIEEQKNYKTIKSKYQLSFRLNNKFLDVVLHNRSIIPKSHINLSCGINGEELSSVYSYKSSGFYLSNYKCRNSMNIISVHIPKVRDDGTEVECIFYLTNLIRHESKEIFKKLLPDYLKSDIKSKDVYINIERNNIIDTNKELEGDAKCILISTVIKFDKLLEDGYNDFTVFISDPLPFELGLGVLGVI